MQFIDDASITIAAGDGGDGMVAWRREKYVPKGGPAGGDGGRGASVYVQATPELSTLVDFRFKRHFAAEAGKPGATSNKSGRSGEDLIIPVPVGTIVYRSTEGQAEAFLADLREPHERLLMAKGGRGGLGNQHFATSARQTPRFAEKGEPGERFDVRLELRLLADCGIVGLPNAGKSTLLSVVSAARPKIADYPFTTLEPQLGVVRIAQDESFLMVDVPGLIEGAHSGAGLGDRFLRHVERTRVIIHLLDGAKSIEELSRDKVTIENELRAWNPAIVEKPTFLVISKLDLPQAREHLEKLRDAFAEIRGVSAASGEGVKALLYAVFQRITQTPLPEISAPQAPRIVLSPRDTFQIRKEDGAFVITGERVERLAAMTDFENDEALGRFEQILAKLGVEKKLRELGAADGDTVRIADNEFTYS